MDTIHVNVVYNLNSCSYRLVTGPTSGALQCQTGHYNCTVSCFIIVNGIVKANTKKNPLF